MSAIIWAVSWALFFNFRHQKICACKQCLRFVVHYDCELAGGVAFKFFDTKRKEGIADVLRYIVLLLPNVAFYMFIVKVGLALQ
jgi:hypothetical protein